MALKKCKECGLVVSSEAATCPHCGAKRVRWGVTTIILCIVFFIVVYKIGTWLYFGGPSYTPQAMHQKHITEREYDQIQRGMSYTEVVKILGKEDSVTRTSSSFDGDTTVVYTWFKSGGSIVSIIMENGRVLQKTIVD